MKTSIYSRHRFHPDMVFHKKKNIFVYLIFAITLPACFSPDWDEIMEEQFPYGVWHSETNYYIWMKENDTYEICNLTECNEGKIAWKNPYDDGFDDYGPYLIDFDKKPLAMKMMEESGYLFLYQRSANHKIRHPSFFQHQSKTSRRFCRSRPCKNFGNEYRPQFHFYLSEG